MHLMKSKFFLRFSCLDSNSSTKASMLIDSQEQIQLTALLSCSNEYQTYFKLLYKYALINFKAEKLRSHAAGVMGKTMASSTVCTLNFNEKYVSLYGSKKTSQLQHSSHIGCTACT